MHANVSLWFCNVYPYKYKKVGQKGSGRPDSKQNKRVERARDMSQPSDMKQIPDSSKQQILNKHEISNGHNLLNEHEI